MNTDETELRGGAGISASGAEAPLLLTQAVSVSGPTKPKDAARPQPGAGSGARGGGRRAAALGAGRRAGRRAGRAGLGLVFVLALFAGLGTLGVLALTGKPIRLPIWAVAEVESRANAALHSALPGAAVSLGGIEIMVEQDWTPRLRLEDLRILQPGGDTLLALPDLRLGFDPQAFLYDRALRPQQVRLIGSSIALRRRVDGSFDLNIGAQQTAPIRGLVDLLGGIDRALETPLLSRLQRIEAEAASLTLEDARSGRVWNVGDGRIVIENRPDALAAQMGLTLVGGGAAPALAQIIMVRPKGQAQVRLTATVDQVAAADIAAQAPVLAWLGVLETAVSGRIATVITADGIAALDAEMTLGAGALRPDGAAKPIAFDRAAISLGYDPTLGRIALTGLSVDSQTLRLTASGHAYPVDAQGRILTGALGGQVPAGFLGQVAIAQAQIDPEGLFERPLVFTQGAMDARLGLDPFRVDIGQVALVEERGRRLSLKGSAGVVPGGWQVALDLGLDAIAHDRLLQLWPKSAVVNTRKWVGDNVATGILTDVKAALRVDPGQETRLSLGYEFDSAEVRFLRTLPPIQQGRGRSGIEGQTYTMVLEAGTVTAPLGGAIDVAGSVFQVTDITAKPAQAVIQLKTDSSITAALSLLDLPPFGFMTKAGQSPDLASGRAVVDTRLSLPLARRVELKDVSYSVTGALRDVQSDALIKGKRVAAPALTLTADPAGLSIAGPGTIGHVPFDVTYSQAFDPAARGKSRVAGSVALSPAMLAEFGIGLPEGLIGGAGSALVDIALEKGAAGRLRLTSDLAGVSMRLAPLGWAKAAAAKGALEVDVTLGQPPQVTALALDAAGLRVAGSVDLRAGGGLERARFTRVALDRWLDASVDLIGRGAGRAPDIVLNGGTVDLRLFDAPAAGGGSTAASTAGKLTVSLDKLVVTDGIQLTGLQGEFGQTGGINGSFRASVNGAAQVTGTVVPSRYGTAVRVQSQDAGRVLAAAGLLQTVGGGSLDLQLTPRATKGHYDGAAQMRNLRVRGASALAELLSAISVVGLLEQLNGDGILFSEASSEFVLTPQALQVTRGSAVGASLGVSIAGLYGTKTKRLALQGVVSPVYLINGIGAALTRRGEGLFGFNFALGGTSDAPQVSVNPLSILTPGMFREIFRSPAPVLKKRDP